MTIAQSNAAVWRCERVNSVSELQAPTSDSLKQAFTMKRTEVPMRSHEFAMIALASVLLICGCSDDARNADFSQQNAIEADIDASLNHGPTASRPDLGVRFNNDLDASQNRGPSIARPGFGFRQ